MSVEDTGAVFSGDDPTCLPGEELSAVSFVMDYVEFHFNGPVLRALTNPVVTVRGDRFQFPDLSSRDALCQLIGEEIQSVWIVEDERIELTTRDAMLTIPLGWETRSGPEAAHFVPVWNDGTPRIEDMLIW